MEWDDTTAAVNELQYQADNRQPDQHSDGAVYQCLAAFGNERSDFPLPVTTGQKGRVLVNVATPERPMGRIRCCDVH